MSSTNPSAAGRRARFGAMTLMLLAAATVSLAVVNALATRYAARFDVTATREHRLSPRSAALVPRLEGEHEIVVAAPVHDRRVVDPRALDPLRDVLDQFEHAGGRIRTTLIDTGSAAGLQQYNDLLKRLADRDADKIHAQTQAVAAALDQAQQISAAMDLLAPRLQAVRDAIPQDTAAGATNASYFDQRAAELTATAQSLRDALAKSRETLAAPSGPLPVPDLDAAAAPIRNLLTQIDAGLHDIAENSRLLAAAPETAPKAKDAAKSAAEAAAPLRDRAALIHDGLERLARIDLLRIARTLQATTAALVIAPSGVTAIDISRLLPSTAAIDATGGSSGARADLGRNAEELIATALASVSQPIHPIVVFVHGQAIRGILQSPNFAGLLDRLALRGIDAAEWAPCLDADPPPLTQADPTGKRPVVYLFLSTDTSQSSPGRGQSGPERAAKLGKAVSTLIDAGKPVLLSLNPSTLPTVGEADPIAAPLALLGLWADTGRPLLKERFTPEGRHVDVAQSLVAEDIDHPIARAVRGLPMFLEWPIAIRPGAGPNKPAEVRGATNTPLYVINDPATWGESQWLSYWQVRAQDRDLAQNKPSKDSKLDDPTGPWPVAVAATRPAPQGGTQRLVAVGSNTWYSDRIAQNRALIDGRPVLTNPGNSELFEACVYWLAGQDDMIATSPTARAVPLIAPLGGGTLLALRWAAILGLPGLVLLTGALWRFWRG
jgi:hypothetical protein